MGLTNHGTQTITFQYFLEATAENWGKRLLDEHPTGIYSGCLMSILGGSSLQLSPMVIEIRDATNQVGVRTSVAAVISDATLDSGAISSATPYLVLRWAHAASITNYVEVHAIASLTVRQQYDLVVGKMLFTGGVLTGVDYTDRSLTHSPDVQLRVEVWSSGGLYVLLRDGRASIDGVNVRVIEQQVGPFTVPAAPYSRIDLVYLNSSGSPVILQGTPSVTPVAPAYGGRFVLAEVKLSNSDTSIPWSSITDVRTFISHSSSSVSSFGSWVLKTVDVVYLADTDGFVCATVQATNIASIQGYTDSNSSPSTMRTRSDNTYAYSGPNTLYSGLTMPVKKGDYWKITTTGSGGTPTASVHWIPLSV